MRKKRAFLLIEVMIAIALLAIALPPLIKGFHQLYLSKTQKYEKIAFELMAREAFINLKATLYLGNGKKWDFQKRVIDDLPPSSSPLSTFSKKSFRTYFISTPLEKYKKKNEESRLLLCEVEIVLEENDKEKASFTYPLLLTQEAL